MSFTKFAQTGSINQSTALPGTTFSSLPSVGVAHDGLIRNDDAGNSAFSPAEPKSLRALAEYDQFHGSIYRMTEEIAENWNDPSKNYTVSVISPVGPNDPPMSGPSGTNNSGLNLSEIPKNKIFRTLGGGWCYPVCEYDKSQEAAGQVVFKFWNSKDISRPFIPYKVKYTWSVSWTAPGWQAPGYPPSGYDTYGLGPPITANGEFDITFDGKSQANAETKTASYPPKPSPYSYVSPLDGQTYLLPWTGGIVFDEVITSVELIAPLPEFWIKQHA